MYFSSYMLCRDTGVINNNVNNVKLYLRINVITYN